MAQGTAGAALLLLAVLALAPPVGAATILVPEEQSLAVAIESSNPGDTLSLSGTFGRIPGPFVKALTLIGRDPTDRPLLRGLVAGGCRLVDLDFAPATLTGEPLPLVTAVASLELVRCGFTGLTRVGVDAKDDGSGPVVVRLEECRFETLVRAADAEFQHPESRIDIRGGEFRALLDGIRLVAPVRDCPPGAPDEPPPLAEGAALLTIEEALFDQVTGAVLRVENATNGLDIRRTRLTNYGRGLELVRAGARVDDCELDGMTGGAIGIDAISSRVEVVRSWIRFHETGLRFRVDGGCERNAGFVGGGLETSCALTGNLVGIDSVDPIAVEANWWGALDCGVAAEAAPGLPLRLITDETRALLFDCGTPVRRATWSLIKSGRFE
jgi:hypothetical protein